MIRVVWGRQLRACHAAGAAAAVAATLVLTSSAASATQTNTPARAAGHTLHTLFDMIRIYARPDMHGPVIGKLTGTGAALSVACWTSGTDYKNISVWYQVTAPMAGYVPAFNLEAHYSPAAHVSHCLVPLFKIRYYSLEPNLRIRRAPSTAASISGLLGSVGSQVVVTCYRKGDAVFGDPIWYHTKAPAAGYVAGRLLNTGGDPAPSVPHC